MSKQPKENKRCCLWYCFRKARYGLQIEVGGITKVIGNYCDKHADIVDELLKKGEIKTDIPIIYE